MKKQKITKILLVLYLSLFLVFRPGFTLVWAQQEQVLEPTPEPQLVETTPIQESTPQPESDSNSVVNNNTAQIENNIDTQASSGENIIGASELEQETIASDSADIAVSPTPTALVLEECLDQLSPTSSPTPQDLDDPDSVCSESATVEESTSDQPTNLNPSETSSAHEEVSLPADQQDDFLESNAEGFTDEQDSSQSKVDNSNVLDLENEFSVEANSGDNLILGNDGDVSLQTGDVDILAQLVNILNLNITGEDFLHLIINIYGDLTSNYDLDSMLDDLGLDYAQVMMISQNNSADSSQTTEIGGTQNTSVNNENTAVVSNDLDISANSGNNILQDNDGDVNLTTGRVKILVSLLNFINSNFTGSHWYFAMLNVFGNIDGDILLPDAEGFLYTNYSPTEQDQAQKQTLSVENNNQTSIENNISATSDTGSNTLLDNDDEATLSTGTASAVVNLVNWVNTNLTGNDWVFLVVNVLGKWVGNIIAFPGLAIFTPADGSKTFSLFAFLNPEQTVLPQSDEDGNQSESNLQVNNSNSVTVTNNINIQGSTGGNQLLTNDGEVNVTTGDSSVTAGILNMVNLNVVGRNWMLMFVNIFGGLSGDIVFSHPDLEVQLVSGQSFANPGSEVVYQIKVANLNNALARNVMLRSTVPGQTQLIENSSGLSNSANILEWPLGDIPAGGEKFVSYKVRVNSETGGVLSNHAQVSTSSHESNLSNNLSSLMLQIVSDNAPNSSGSNDDTLIIISESHTSISSETIIDVGQNFISKKTNDGADSEPQDQQILGESAQDLNGAETQSNQEINTSNLRFYLFLLMAFVSGYLTNYAKLEKIRLFRRS